MIILVAVETATAYMPKEAEAFTVVLDVKDNSYEEEDDVSMIRNVVTGRVLRSLTSPCDTTI